MKSLIIFGMALVLFALWFVLSALNLIQGPEARLEQWLPGWLIAANLFLCPALALPTSGPWKIPVPLRYFLGILLLGSIIVLEVSFRRQAIASSVSLGILLLEVFWLVPRLRRS